MEVESIARFLFYFALCYAAYSLALYALPIGTSGRQELADLIDRTKRNSLLIPFRPVIWLVFIPCNSVLAALAVSLCAAVCAWLIR